MSVIDIIIIVTLVWAAWRGIKEGVVLQLGGLVGLFIGVWLGIHFGRFVGNLLGAGELSAGIIGMLNIVPCILIAIAIIGRITKGFLKFTGLSLFDSMGGAILSIIKAALVIGMLLYALDISPKRDSVISNEKIAASKLYRPLIDIASGMIPHLNQLKELL